jgi:hypothetical protein
MALRPMSLPTRTPLLFAVWGASANDVYALGGNAECWDPPLAEIHHFDGSAWELVYAD